MEKIALPFVCECKDQSSQIPSNNLTEASVNDVNVSTSLGKEDAGRPNTLISDAVRYLVEMIVIVLLNGIIAGVGSIANVINIIVFCKQGLNDTVNISLLGLAVSDLSSDLTLAWMSLCMNPLFRYSDIPFESNQLQHITAGEAYLVDHVKKGSWPMDCFSRTTCWITAYVTFERCLCIAFPLKIKNIITVKRTAFVILGIFLVIFTTTSPAFYAFRIQPTYIADREKTLLGLVYMDGGPFLENIVYYISAFTKLSSFSLVIVCTIVLIRSLLSKSQWRKTASDTSASGANITFATLRDKRVVKMVSFIACIFIACSVPSCINIILIMSLSPHYNINGQFQNAFAMSWAIISCLEATNGSVNIFIYYKMSSKYKAVFKKLFGIDRQSKRIRRY